MNFQNFHHQNTNMFMALANKDNSTILVRVQSYCILNDILLLMGQCLFNMGIDQFQNQNCFYKKGNGGFKNGQH
jgi:hypothetical protein